MAKTMGGLLGGAAKYGTNWGSTVLTDGAYTELEGATVTAKKPAPPDNNKFFGVIAATSILAVAAVLYFIFKK